MYFSSLKSNDFKTTNFEMDLTIRIGWLHSEVTINDLR